MAKLGAWNRSNKGRSIHLFYADRSGTVCGRGPGEKGDPASMHDADPLDVCVRCWRERLKQVHGDHPPPPGRIGQVIG